MSHCVPDVGVRTSRIIKEVVRPIQLTHSLRQRIDEALISLPVSARLPKERASEPLFHHPLPLNGSALHRIVRHKFLRR